MDSKDATKEFVRLLRIGGAALSSVLEADQAKDLDVKPELDEIRFLLDGLEDVGERLQEKLSRAS